MNRRPVLVSKAESMRRWRARNLAAGLTVRGDARQIRLERFRAVKIDPAELRAEGVILFGHVDATSIVFVMTEKRLVVMHAGQLPSTTPSAKRSVARRARLALQSPS